MEGQSGRALADIHTYVISICGCLAPERLLFERITLLLRDGGQERRENGTNVAWRLSRVSLAKAEGKQLRHEMSKAK